MAISRIAGQMLQTNLERDGVNLSFSNLDLGNSTPVLYLDVGNNRVGINKSSASYTLDVVGNINATANITSASVSASGNVTGGNVITNNVYSSSGTLSLYTNSNGNILLTPEGTGISKAIGTNGFVIPSGNTSQRPGTPDTGTIRFNTQLIQTEIWDGAAWVSATGTTSAIVNQTINGDGSTQTFSLDYSATAESIIVTINGVVQTPGVSYTTDTGLLTITFTEPPAISDIIQVRYIASTMIVAEILNGTSNVYIPVSNGAVTISSGGVANMVSVSNTAITMSGNLNPSANLVYSLGNNTNRWSNLWVGGNTIYLGNIQLQQGAGNSFVVYQSDGVTPANLSSVGSVSTTGNVTAGNVSGNIITNSIVNSGANATGNIGSSSNYFNTVFAKATSAQYADLAEWYSADADYPPGTVVKFGGTAEVTVCDNDADPCVAGVVSANPSYAMNAGLTAEHKVCVALVGRVPCHTVGSGKAGSMMVSAGYGRARVEKTPSMGTVIGKALHDFSDTDSTVEVVVGRL